LRQFELIHLALVNILAASSSLLALGVQEVINANHYKTVSVIKSRLQAILTGSNTQLTAAIEKTSALTKTR
jgi:hypothetical protein